jgi:O-antigen/teichoic acid export membrane protein
MALEKIRGLLKHEMAGLLGGSAFIFGIRLAGAAVTFLTQWLLVHWMGAAELGKYVFAFSLASILAFVSTLGLPVAAMRVVPQALAKGENGLAEGFLRRTISIVLPASLALAAITLSATLAVSSGSSAADATTLIVAACLIPFLAALGAQNDIGRSIYLVASTFVPNMLLRHLFLLAGVSGFFYAGVQLNAALTMSVLLVTVAVLTVGQFLYIRRKARVVIGNPAPRYETKSWVAMALPLVIVFGFTGFFLEINMALAGAFLPSADLAVYNLSFQIANLIAFFLVAVGYQFGPYASHLLGEGNLPALQRLISHTANIRFIFAIFMFALLALVGPFVLGIFGEAFVTGGYNALLILAGTQVVAGVAGPVAVLQSIIGMERPAIIISAFAVAADVILTPILVSQFGIDGAALAVLATMTIWNGLFAIAILRNSPLDPTVLGLGGLLLGHRDRLGILVDDLEPGQTPEPEPVHEEPRRVSGL